MTTGTLGAIALGLAPVACVPVAMWLASRGRLRAAAWLGAAAVVLYVVLVVGAEIVRRLS